MESGALKTRVILTVDVEPSVAGAFDDPAANTPLLHEPVWGEVAGRSEALGFLIRTLRRHGLEATFFVETVHTAWFPPDLMGRYAAELAGAGQDVQLHLHPTWCNFRNGGPTGKEPVSDDCHRIGTELLVRLIEEGADRIEEWTGRRPTAMRTGNFSTDRSVFAAMRRAGLRYASNICSAVQTPPEPELAYLGGVYEVEGIVELPVTCFADRGPVGRGRPRPLQVTACSFAETRAMLNQLHAAGGAVAVIVTHPFEFLKRDDHRFANMRPNRLVQSRFEQLCAFLAGNADRFRTERLEAAAQALTPPDAPPALAGSPFDSVVRAAQNLINDRIL
jgi:peptidoglycan/xylan/chitin deacetylase (PgdA/CDA1 family)